MNETHLPGILAGLGIVGLLLAALTTLFWVWMLVDCASNTRLQGVEKIVWLLVIFFLHVLGAIIYFAVARGPKPGPRGA